MILLGLVCSCSSEPVQPALFEQTQALVERKQKTQQVVEKLLHGDVASEPQVCKALLSWEANDLVASWDTLAPAILNALEQNRLSWDSNLLQLVARLEVRGLDLLRQGLMSQSGLLQRKIAKHIIEIPGIGVQALVGILAGQQAHDWDRQSIIAIALQALGSAQDLDELARLQLMGKLSSVVLETVHKKPGRLSAAQQNWFKPIVQYYQKTLSQPDIPLKITVLEQIGALGTFAEQTIPQVLVALRSEAAGVREAAAAALPRLGPQVATVVRPLLADKDMRLRQVAVEILGELGLSETKSLFAVRHDPQAGVRLRVYSALASFSATPEIDRALAQALQQEDEKIKIHILEKLGGHKKVSPRIITTLTRLLAHKSPQVVERVIDLLTRWSNQSGRAKPALVRLCRSGPSELKPKALDALVALGYSRDQILAMLVNWMQDKEGAVRIASCAYLTKLAPGLMKAGTSLARLKKLFELMRKAAVSDEDPAVRQAASESFVEMQQAMHPNAKPPVPAIFQEYEHQGDDLRSEHTH